METNTLLTSERLPAVNALFWGLMIVFIDINLGDFDIVSDLLGLLIVTIALFRLRPYSKRFRQGYFCSLSALSFQVFDTLRLFPSGRTQPVLSGVFSVIGLLLSLLVLFLILSGLAQLAERQQLPSLGERLRHSFIFYCITTLLTLAFSGITVLAVAVLVFCFVFYIMILRGIRSAYCSLSSAMLQPDQPGKPGAGWKTATLSVVCFLMPSVIIIGGIWFADYHPVNSAPYRPPAIQEQAEKVEEIRGKMERMGVDSTAVRDLPDSEILQYATVTYLQKSDEKSYECDGGRLKTMQYFFTTDTQDCRLLLYYEWLKKPVLAHSEVLGVSLPTREEPFHDQRNLFSLHLYDMPDGTTYTTDTIQRKESLGNTAVEFRLSRHPSADHFRGYLAYSIRSAIRPYATNTVLYYLHQSTLFHNEDTPIFDYYHENTGFSLEEDAGLVKRFFKKTTIDLK